MVRVNLNGNGWEITFSDQPERVTCETQVFAACRQWGHAVLTDERLGI